MLSAAKKASEARLLNRKWVLKARPEGVFSAEACAELAEEHVDLTDLGPEELVVTTEWLAVDAFLRTMLDEGAFHGAVPIGGTLPALGIGVVAAAGARAKLKVGAKCYGMVGAQTVARVTPGELGPWKLMKVPGLPDTASLGLLGLTQGITAWVGTFKVLPAPKKGETVVVTAAAGGVGSIAAQLALTTGARVVGVAGGGPKCEFLRETLKLHGAVDYKSEAQTVAQQLEALCPDGVDFMYDNVGGPVLDEVLRRINKNARVVICGAVSQYSGGLNKGRVVGPSEYLKLAERNATMKGFTVNEYSDSTARATASLLWDYTLGRVTVHEHVEEGFDRFPGAMEKMFTGGHMGRLLVKVNEKVALELKV